MEGYQEVPAVVDAGLFILAGFSSCGLLQLTNSPHQLFLKPTVRGTIVNAFFNSRRKIILPDDGSGVAMRIFIALSMFQLLRPRVIAIAQMLGRSAGAFLLHVLHRPVSYTHLRAHETRHD